MKNFLFYLVFMLLDVNIYPVEEPHFVIDKVAVKTEPFVAADDMEYVDEEIEYAIEENVLDNDEDTNDGFEDEHGIVKSETTEESEAVVQTEGRRIACDFCPKVFGK